MSGSLYDYPLGKRGIYKKKTLFFSSIQESVTCPQFSILWNPARRAGWWDGRSSYSFHSMGPWHNFVCVHHNFSPFSWALTSWWKVVVLPSIHFLLVESDVIMRSGFRCFQQLPFRILSNAKDFCSCHPTLYGGNNRTPELPLSLTPRTDPNWFVVFSSFRSFFFYELFDAIPFISFPF